MILYKSSRGPVVERDGRWYAIAPESEHGDWDALVNRDDLFAVLSEAIAADITAEAPEELLPPIGAGQELWAAGVTYLRSKSARMEESQKAGGSDFYDRVYHAERPELFMKATPGRVVGHGGAMRLRRDSKWIVPEPELTLVIARSGKIVGYTVGNDLSCRDIEGENPLYLPQAKTFDACAALGPGIFVTDKPLPTETAIRIDIRRQGASIFAGSTTVSQMKKPLHTLVEYLYRECSFPSGALLMTGTGVVPPGEFSLCRGDAVRITIEPIGTLVNTVE